jgi:maleate cis-trans isomerase
MFEEFLPKKKIGYLSPLAIIDYFPYQFYQLVPKGAIIVTLSVGLKEFTAKDVERVFAPLEEHVRMLTEHGVDIIVQGGVPLPILGGVDFHDRLLARIEKVGGVPASSTITNVLTAAKALGIRNVALANKWSPEMNKSLGLFFAKEGIKIAGSHTKSMAPSEFLKQKTDESLTLAYNLGRGALLNYPEADGLYIGGGAWLTYPIIDALEKEFKKPVVSNVVATIWHVCRLLGIWKPVQGYGRLLQIP